MGTLTNGRTTIPYDNWTAPHLNWRKAGRTDLGPILKGCVMLGGCNFLADRDSCRTTKRAGGGNCYLRLL
ncbi:hypothetical protein ABZ819_11395 [Streptomyces venezuelae]|uniref:hypothetical protein n=1 Tax=Streptomyces venezuelae TaxID=54571 RepID=UPI0034146BCA